MEELCVFAQRAGKGLMRAFGRLIAENHTSAFCAGFFFLGSVLRFLQSRKWMKASPTETPPLSRYYSTHPNTLE